MDVRVGPNLQTRLIWITTFPLHIQGYNYCLRSCYEIGEFLGFSKICGLFLLQRFKAKDPLTNAIFELLKVGVFFNLGCIGKSIVSLGRVLV